MSFGQKKNYSLTFATYFVRFLILGRSFPPHHLTFAPSPDAMRQGKPFWQLYRKTCMPTCYVPKLFFANIFIELLISAT